MLLRIYKIISRKSLIICLVILLVTFLRFYKVGEWFFFGIDEEYQSLLALAQIKDFHPIWIGLSAANTGFYVGPGLVYLHAILLWISHGDPIILAYTASTIGVMTAVVFYLIVKSIFNKRIALIATALYSCSAFVANYDRRFWNSTLVPLVAILIYWTLVKLQKDEAPRPNSNNELSLQSNGERNPSEAPFSGAKGDRRYLMLLAFLLGCIFHIHASLFLFIPIILYFAIMSLRTKATRPESKKKRLIFTHPFFMIIYSFLIFLFIYSPLLVYDFVHNFDNLKTPLRMLTQTQGSGGGVSFVQHWQVFRQTISHFWISALNHPFHQNVIAYLSILTILIFLFKIKKFHETILAIIVFVYLLMFFLFPGAVLEYYYLGFFPFFSLIIALFLNAFDQKIYLPFIIIIVFCNCLFFLNQNPTMGLSSQKKLVIKTTKFLNNQPYFLDTTENYLHFGGWRYLFTVYGQKPARSRADDHFGWIYLDEIINKTPQLTVIVTTKKYVSKKKIIKTVVEEPYRAYIVKN